MSDTSGVRLRAIEDADLPTILAHQGDQVAAAMAAFPTRDPAAFYAHWAKIRADPTCVTRAIVADGTLVGDIGSWVDDEDGHQMVGYWIGQSFWGRGYATAALRLLLEEVPARPMYAHVAEHNIGSRRVLEHCGFVLAGETDSDGVRERLYRLDGG